MTKQKAVGILRVALSLLAFAALGVGYDRDVHTGDAVNFFFYFTDLSNVFGALVLLLGGIAALRGRPGLPDLVRGSAVLYLVITGLVYWALLADTITAETIKWQNYIVHGVMPVVFVLDWLLVPPLARLSNARASRWLAYPLIYLAVSLIRGPIVSWWPYDFLDPQEPGGYTHVTTWSLIVTAIFVLFTFLIAFAGNQLGSRRSVSVSGDSDDPDGSSGTPSRARNFSSRSA